MSSPTKAPPLSREAVMRLLGTAPTPVKRRHPAAFPPKHSDEKVAEIRKDRASGMPVLVVAAKHGVSGAYVSLLHNNRLRRVDEPSEE